MEKQVTMEEKLKEIQNTYDQARKAFLVDKDSKKALKMFRVLMLILGSVNNDVLQIKKDATKQKQLLLSAAATPVELPEGLAANTDHEIGSPQIAGDIIKKKSLLSDDLEYLIDKMIKRNVLFSETSIEGSIQARQKHLAKAFAKGGIGNIIKGIRTMPGIKSTESLGSTLELVAKNSKVAAWLKEKKEQATAKVDIFRKIQNVRKIQKKEKKSSFLATAGQLVVGNMVNKLTNLVKETVEQVKTVAKGAIANSRVGRQLLNETTRISDDLHEMSSEVKSFGQAIKNKVNGGIRWTTKAFKAGYDVVGIGGKALTSIVNSALPTAAVFILTGGNIPLTVAYLSASTGIKTYLKILNDPNLSSFKVIRNAQIKYGRGIFYDVYGKIKIGSITGTGQNSLFHANLKGLSASQQSEVLGNQKLIAERIVSQNKLGRLDAKWLRLVEGADAVLSWAPIGALIGNYFFGAPIIGSVVGAFAGLGMRAVKNALEGGKIPFLAAKDLLKEGSLTRFIAEVPFTQFAGQYMSNMWMGMQMDMIKNKYDGDVGAYFRDNWNPFYNSNIFKSVNVFANFLELGGMGLAIKSGVMGNFLMKAASSVFRLGGIAAVSKLISLTPPQITACYIAGSTIALLASVLLGIPIGPAMLLGVTIGSAVGLVVGIGVSALVSWFTGGIGAWTSAAIITGFSALGGTIGGWFGSLGDKAIGLTGGMLMNFMQGMLALVQMLALLQQKISLDNVMPIAIGLITLMSTLYRMGVFDTANQCLENEYCPPTEATTSLDNQPNLLELKAFGVFLITPQETKINSDTTALITSYLETNIEDLQNKFSNKTIFINLTNNESFIDDKFVILGIDLNSNYSDESITHALDESVVKSANTQSLNKTDYAFLNVK